MFIRQGVDHSNGEVIRQAMQDAVEAATRNNATIYGIDPRGLAFNRADLNIGEISPHPSLLGEVQGAQKSLRTISDETGGFAVVDRNSFDAAYQQVVAENSAYYVLGYYPVPERHDGKFHKIAVRVDRPGISVDARKGYLAAKPQKSRTVASASSDAAGGLDELLASPIPATGLTMRIFAAPFKGASFKPSILLGTELSGRDLMKATADRVDISYWRSIVQGRPRITGPTRSPSIPIQPIERASSSTGSG